MSITDRPAAIPTQSPRLPLLMVLLVLSTWTMCGEAAEPFRVDVRDQENGWPVPLVELRTTHGLRFITDNAGVIAMDAPELFGREVWFTVRGHGYEVPADGFGFHGVKFTPEPGGRRTIDVNRTIIAKRLGRLTGVGLFAESQQLGERTDWRDSPVFGSDSVQNAVHRGRMYWAWGDTNVAGYPLGVFEMTTASTSLHPFASFEPPVVPSFEYLTDERGRPRAAAHIPGEGPTWLTGYVSLPDRAGEEHLVATYRKVKAPMEVYETGLCEWNEDIRQFEPVEVTWRKDDGDPPDPLVADGHPAFWTDESGKKWLLFGNPLPRVRLPATYEDWRQHSRWERLTPQAHLAAAPNDRQVEPHSGSIAWNEYRGRWVSVFMEKFGKPSAFGELWYAEADSPFGPWGPCIKVLSHDNYTFYNPRLHPEFTPDDSPILLFEGTYSAQFADHPDPTPRYDYNQILYRLDLDDPQFASGRSAR